MEYGNSSLFCWSNNPIFLLIIIFLGWAPGLTEQPLWEGSHGEPLRWQRESLYTASLNLSCLLADLLGLLAGSLDLLGLLAGLLQLLGWSGQEYPKNSPKLCSMKKRIEQLNFKCKFKKCNLGPNTRIHEYKAKINLGISMYNSLEFQPAMWALF